MSVKGCGGSEADDLTSNIVVVHETHIESFCCLIPSFSFTRYRQTRLPSVFEIRGFPFSRMTRTRKSFISSFIGSTSIFDYLLMINTIPEVLAREISRRDQPDVFRSEFPFEFLKKEGMHKIKLHN